MLEPEEVDEGYFTPVASTTLANIFKSDSGNDESVNASLKYRPPPPKKTEQNPKMEDPNASICVFSCSLIAYEWKEGAHKCKGKVGFAIMRIVSKDICKVILYSPDKSTLSCTTVSPQLEVTLKGAMISLYDDHKKYWGLCFDDKNFKLVKEILQRENVTIKHYENPHSNNSEPVRPEVESEDIDGTENDPEDSNDVEANAPILRNDKASIMSRIANVGHAILPSTPASPVKKSTPVEKMPPTETFESPERLSVISDGSESSGTIAAKSLTRSIAIQASENNNGFSNSTAPIFAKLDAQNPFPNVPIDNNQVFSYINGCMVPVRTHVPVITNLGKECGIYAADIGLIIEKLTHLQGLVKTMEIIESLEKGNNQKCTCEDKVHDQPTLEVDTTDAIIEGQNEQNLRKIRILEELIKEKDDVIMKMQGEVNVERMKSSDLINEYNINTNRLERQVENLKQDLISKDEELKNMILKREADILIANTVKKLMNDIFRSLTSNFESDASYSGSIVKGVLANVIKKHTVESLSSLMNNRDASNVPADLTE